MRVDVDSRAMLLGSVPKGGVAVEIGVHKGDFSQRILAATKPSQLYLIDPWKIFGGDTYSKSWYGENVTQETMDARCNAVERRFAQHISSGKVQIIRDLSASAAAKIPDDSADFIYIDGDHTYEGVAADVESYWPKLKVGGILAGDDYSLEGWWGDGVVRAFNQALASHNCAISMKMDAQIAIRKLG